MSNRAFMMPAGGLLTAALDITDPDAAIAVAQAAIERFGRIELLVEGASTIWPELTIEDYADRTAQTIAAWKGMNGQQGGDPAKLAVALGPCRIREIFPCVS